MTDALTIILVDHASLWESRSFRTVFESRLNFDALNILDLNDSPRSVTNIRSTVKVENLKEGQRYHENENLFLTNKALFFPFNFLIPVHVVLCISRLAFSEEAINWHRVPYVSIFLFSSLTIDEYRSCRPAIKNFVETAKKDNPLSREYLILYCPVFMRSQNESQSKKSKSMSKKVFEKLQVDFEKAWRYNLFHHVYFQF